MKKIIEFDKGTLRDAAGSLMSNKEFTGKLKKVDQFTATDELTKAEVRNEKLRDTIETVERFAFAIANDGFDPITCNQVEVKDIDATIKNMTTDMGVGSTGILTSQVLTRSLQYIPEPTPIYRLISTKMTYKTGTQVVIPYIGAANGALDIGPGQEIPVISLDRSAEVISNTGRSGIAIGLPEETMRNSNYPILSLYMQKAREALGRFKNDKAVKTLLANSTVLFNNANPGGSVHGYTSGRDLAEGKLNGSFTLRDLHKMYQELMIKGYLGDTILCSQWGYLMFMYEPVLRKFMEFNNGVLFASPNGGIGNNGRNDVSKRSREEGPAKAHSTLEPNMGLANQLTSANFRVIVTNYIPTYFEGEPLLESFQIDLNTEDNISKFTASNVRGTAANITNRTSCVANVVNEAGAEGSANEDMFCGKLAMTDLVMCDSSNALLYLEEEGVKVDSKYDNLTEFLKVYLRERYVFTTLEKGRGIVSARNIVITEDTYDYLYRVESNVSEMQAAMTHNS